MIHRIQFWTGSWQQANLYAQVRRELPTVFGCGGCSSILKQHDSPTAPMTPYHVQKVLVRLLVPNIGDQQQHITTSDIDGSVKYAPGAAASDRNAGLLAYAAVTTIQWRRFANYRLIKHENDCALLGEKATFEPPFACRQLSGLSARLCRGRFHRIPRRAMAKLTLSEETDMRCSSRR